MINVVIMTLNTPRYILEAGAEAIHVSEEKHETLRVLFKHVRRGDLVTHHNAFEVLEIPPLDLQNRQAFHHEDMLQGIKRHPDRDFDEQVRLPHDVSGLGVDSTACSQYLRLDSVPDFGDPVRVVASLGRLWLFNLDAAKNDVVDFVADLAREVEKTEWFHHYGA